MSNVFEKPVAEMNEAEVNEAIERVTGWAEEWGWDQSDTWYEDDPEQTAAELLEELTDRLDQLNR